MSKGLIIGGIIVILAVGGILWLQQNTPEQSRVSDDWLTYRNEDLSYQFSYPPRWNVSVERSDPFLSVIKLEDSLKTTQNYVRLFSGRSTGRDTFGFSCMAKVDEEMVTVDGVSGKKQVFETRSGTFRPQIEIQDFRCEDPLGVYAVLVDFSINGTDDPIVDSANPEYKEYSFEFYIFDDNLTLVDDILSSFEFVR